MAGFDEAQARAALTTMLERLAKGPFVTLGIDPSANADDVRQAFLTLTKRYHPAKYARMSGELQRQANEVFLQIRSAHDTIARSLPKLPKRAAVTRHATPPHGLPIEPASSGRSTPPRGLTMPNQRAPSGTPNRAPSPPHATSSGPNRAPAPAPAQGRLAPPPGRAPLVASGTEPRPRTPSNGATNEPSRPTPNPLRPNANANDASSSRLVADPKSIPPSRAGSGPRPAIQPPRAPTPAFGVRTPPVTPPKPQKTQPLPVVTPVFDETAELAAGQELLRRGEWRAARMTLQALANKVSQSRHYRAILAYAKAKETPTDRLVDDAIAELERFIQSEPSHAIAKAALADLRRK